MKIKCFPVKMTEKEAIRIASGGGNIVGKLLYGKKDINLRLMYLESRYITYEMTYVDNVLSTIFTRNKKPDKQKIRAIVETTTCSAAYAPDDINLTTIDVDENSIQNSNYDDERLIHAGKDTCRRMVRRQLGRNMTMEVLNMEKVYRPFYIAIYGELKEGTKARYLPIAADGNEVIRTF